MSDTALNKIIQYGTRADRIAFTPSPASGSQVLYLWYETDHAPDTWAWDGSAWQQINTGAGSVTTTGSPASGNLTKFSGSNTITNGDLSGDVATSGTLATTIQANAVTTSKINASAVTLAKIANASANSVLVGSGAAGSGSAYSEIALGTGLSMSGTTLSASGASGGLVLLEQHTASSSTELDFTSCISSTYDEYEIHLVSVVPATSGAILILQVSTNGGSTYDSTAGHYSWQAFFSAFNANSANGSASDGSIGLTTGLNNAAGTSVSGRYRLYSPANTSLYLLIEGTANAVDSSRTTASVGILQAGKYTVTGGSAVNAFRIMCNSGNIASGTIRVYGLAK